MALANLSICYTWKNIKSEYNNNKFRISARTWNAEFNLPDASYSISDIQDYFEYIIRKYEAIPDNPPVQIHVNKIINRIVFKIKTGYKFELGQLTTITPHSATMLQKKLMQNFHSLKYGSQIRIIDHLK